MPGEVVGCDMLVSPKNPAIGAPTAMASTADTKSLFIFIAVFLFRSMWPRVRWRRRASVTRAEVLEHGDRTHDFLRAHDAGVVREIDIERGAHVLVRVVGRRVAHDGNLVAKLSGIADRRLDAGMRDESDHDELVDAVLLELQIQISVGEAAGAPVLQSDDLAWFGREFGTQLATPCAVFEGLSAPRRPLDRGNVFPGLVVARTVSMMQGIEDRKLRRPRGVQDLQHVSDTAVRLRNSPDAGPYLSPLGDEIVVRIDHQKGSKLLVVCHFGHSRSPMTV